MSESKFSVRHFRSDDKNDWDKLWYDYNEDYEYARDPAVIESNWKAIISDDGRLHALALASDTNRPIGFGLYVTYYSTKTILPDCYLSDLFIAPEYRKQGGAKLLMKKIFEDCKQKKMGRVIWVTQKHNIEAQKLYEKIAQGTEWMRYKTSLT